MSAADKKPPPDPELPGALTPGPAAPVGPRSCLFYGCAIASALALLLFLALGLGLLVAYHYRGQIIDRFTAREPAPIPVVELPGEDLKSLKSRLKQFQQAADTGAGDTITLSEQQINGLIASESDVRGRIAVRLEPNRIRALVSFPLDEIGLPSAMLEGVKGRYLNGWATIDPSVEGAYLVLSIRRLEVQGRNVPASILNRLVANRSVRFRLDDGDRRDDVGNRITSLTISEGKLRVELRPAAPALDLEAAPPRQPAPSAPAAP